MAIAIDFPGFNDLKRLVTPIYFSFQKQILFTIISTLSKNEQKNQCGKLKKTQDFCPWGIESRHLVSARRVKLWSLNANLFFKKPRQLTKFT